MKKLIFIILSLVFGTVFSQVKFTASAPGAVQVNQRFYLKYTINEEGENLKIPNLSGFRILSGPNSSYSSSVSIVNGSMSQNTSYTYTLILLATKEGKFTLQPATINVNGKTIKSNKLTIEVVKGGANTNSNSNTNQNNNSNTGVSSTELAGKNLYVKTLVDKRSLYKGEQLTATVKLYTKYDIRGFQDAKYPSWNGFYKQDIPMPDQISLNKENINGEIYYTAILDKVVLQAQKTGELIIDPAKFEVVVLIKTGRRRSFFDSGYEQKVVKIKSNPIKINVKSLPPAPEGFNGAVGDFKLSANIDKKNVDVNDAISLKIKISGSGNLKLVGEPKINFPPDFELFDDAKISDKINNSSAGSSGSKEFEYIFSPRHSGTYKIPSFNFVYFNPKLKKYKTLTSTDFVIKVNQGDGDTTVSHQIVTGVSKEDIQYLGKDILFIKTSDLKLKEKGFYIFGSPLFIFVYIFSIIIFIIAFVVLRKRIKDNANISLVRNKKAGKLAKKHLKNANISLKANDKNKFYEDITRAIFGYISDKLNISTSELSRENIKDTLINHEIDNSLIDELLNIIDTCEFERYAPSSKEDRLSEIYKTTETLINKFERNIKGVKV